MSQVVSCQCHSYLPFCSEVLSGRFASTFRKLREQHPAVFFIQWFCVFCLFVHMLHLLFLLERGRVVECSRAAAALGARPGMTVVQAQATVREAVAVALEAGHSRLPVFDGSLDRIVGVVYAKDLLRFVGRANADASIVAVMRPPLFVPRAYWDLECPQVFFVDGHAYLMAAIMEDRSQRYWQAPRFEGPYEVPPDGGVLAPPGHYAGRVCSWRQAHLYFCWPTAYYDCPGTHRSA